MTVAPTPIGRIARVPARLPGLSVVLPAFNEAATVERVLRELLAVLPEVTAQAEVVVVDDGSRDDTAMVAAAVPGVRVVHHARNRGYGAALRTGLLAGSEPWAFFTDADGQFDARDLVRLVAASGDTDIVAGYRAPRADRLGRRLAGVAWTRLVRLLLGVPLRDVNCAFKLIRREVLDTVTLAADGALLNAELLGKAVRCGFRVREVPVAHRPRRDGRPTGGSPRVVWRAFRELRALAADIRAAAPPAVREGAADGATAAALRA